MARTRGASVHHADDGELLDKEGNPIPVEALDTPEAALAALAAEANRAPEEPAEPAAPPVYRCDVTTCQRDLGGWELIRILDLMMGGFSVEVDAQDYGRLPADVKQHFRMKR